MQNKETQSTYEEVCEELKKLYEKFLYKRDRIVEYNLRLVIAMSKRYYKRVVEFNEIIQLGNIGLMKACEKYDPTFNACFSTYAYYWIRQSITREIAQMSCPVSVPINVYMYNLSLKRSIEVLRKELRRQPRVEEIAEYIGEKDLEKIRVTMQAFAVPVSLNESISSSSDGDDFTMLDSIEDENSNIFSLITKKDLLPKSVKEYKLLEYINTDYVTTDDEIEIKVFWKFVNGLMQNKQWINNGNEIVSEAATKKLQEIEMTIVNLAVAIGLSEKQCRRIRDEDLGKTSFPIMIAIFFITFAPLK